MTLADDLRDWTDRDGAGFLLGVHLGAVEGSWLDNKGLFWTDNPVGNGLDAALLALVDATILEYRDGPSDDQFRWSPDYQPRRLPPQPLPP